MHEPDPTLLNKAPDVSKENHSELHDEERRTVDLQMMLDITDISWKVGRLVF